MACDGTAVPVYKVRTRKWSLETRNVGHVTLRKWVPGNTCTFLRVSIALSVIHCTFYPNRFNAQTKRYEQYRFAIPEPYLDKMHRHPPPHCIKNEELLKLDE
uniref:AlNc14C5G783 protein n=1 Tax=Albugo laibachii Nc14 TaxID=890382 RepID=F0W103_9STRA|nr:AlNc14C5G783 [Albugo laibachii Nc14]|eukprot:CCA14727.1 AlNc14C5G783 [Albugo laibachii Nc14]